jgi:hypothetical protein
MEVIRAESLRNHGDIELATAFYSDNRDEMDEGARIAWPERFNFLPADRFRNREEPNRFFSTSHLAFGTHRSYSVIRW